MNLKKLKIAQPDMAKFKLMIILKKQPITNTENDAN